jgi:hypothetical protein
MSFGREHISNFKDLEEDPALLQLLDGTGVLELLEQDDRSAFIIDLENEANFNPGTLQILFTNASLRAYDSILDMVMGNTDLNSPWLLSIINSPSLKRGL